MAIDFNDPEVQKAIQAQAEQQAAVIIDQRVEEEVDRLKAKNYEVIGKNKDLAEKIKQYDGIDPADLDNLRRLSQAKEHDEIVNLVVSGNIEEAKARMTEGAVDPWRQKTEELSNQFQLAQESLSEREKKIKEYEGKVESMQKKQFLRELTSSDDSFKHEHFDDFYELNKNKMTIDENGNVLAVKDGKPVFDTEGRKVSFEDYYNKQKVGSGLFWQGGQGSSAKGMAGKEGFSGDPTAWTAEQKHAYITENGVAEYAKLIQSKKGK